MKSIQRFIKFFAVLLFSAFFLTIYSCDEKKENHIPDLNDSLGFNISDYESALKQSFILSDTNNTLYKSVKENLDSIKSYYSANNFKPIFIKSFVSKTFVDSLFNILASANEHGLNPENYNYTELKTEFNNAINPAIQNNQKYIHLANAEMLAANALLKFSEHMRHGVVNPRILFTKSYYLPVTDSLNRRLFEPFSQNNVIQYLIDIQPKSIKYKSLQSALNKFEKLKNTDWTTIPIPSTKIEAGNIYGSANLVIEKLFTLGFLDTSKVKIQNLGIYDSALVEPIKNFQKANGLTEDGVIGKTTIERLNITPKDYIEKIKLTLERFRWLDYSDTARYILVNIPDFKVYAIENGIDKFNINVCAGRKGYWETPNLYSDLSYMVLNPTWSVPKSIIKEEIVSGLRKDSLYLKKRNFIVYKSGVKVSLDGLTASQLNTSQNYTMIQNPGAGNALGKIKFMFKNPFGVYLHDTPTRAPFSYVNRAVSHGCVRVEKPMILAEYLLNNNSKWTADFIKIEIGQKIDDPIVVKEFNEQRNVLRKDNSYGVTTEVKFNNTIPLFIDYYTVWVDENGIFNYRDDVYGRDKVLKEYLSKYF